MFSGIKIAALSAVPILMESAVDIKTMFSSALSSIQGDVNGLIGLALPVGLSIAGTFLATKLGVRFFKGISK